MSGLLITPEKYLKTSQLNSYQAPTLSSRAKQRSKSREFAPAYMKFSMEKRRPTINLDSSPLSSSPGAANLSTIDDLSNEHHHILLNNEQQSHSLNMSDSHEQELELEYSEKTGFDAKAIIRNVLKGADKEFNQINHTWIGEILDDIITAAYNGISIDKLNYLSDSSRQASPSLDEGVECDYLSSRTVIGSDESGEKRDLALIPNGEETCETLDEVVCEDEKEFVDKIFITEPDIEIFGTKLADKVIEEKMFEDKDVTIAGDITLLVSWPTEQKGKTMAKEIAKMKRNVKNMGQDFEKSDKEKPRGCCVGKGICNIF